jgi:GntR family transcriptional regulator
MEPKEDDRAAGYRDLASVLRAALQRGDFPPGSTLPKQKEIARQHGVNLGTVHKAVAVLEAEGLVTPVRRRGTVVRERPPMRRLGADRYAKSKWKFGNLVAFAADRDASARSWSPTEQTQTVRLVAADLRVAEALGVNPGQMVYERARLVKEGDTPTHSLTSYYRVEDVEGTPLVDPSPGPAGRGGGFAVLTMQGLEPHHMTETIRGRMPTPEEAVQLHLPAGEPVMILERHTYTSDNRLVEFARGVHAASRFAWTYSFIIPD